MLTVQSSPPCLLLCLLVAACDASIESSPKSKAVRFEAVTTAQKPNEAGLAGFCDVRDAGNLPSPPGESLELPRGQAHWVNVWATWCKSCVEEFPMMDGWARTHGHSVVYLSADEDPEALTRFAQEHPALAKPRRLKEPEKVADWMRSLGLDEGAGLPLHLFVSADGSLRCARAATVSEHHFPIIQSLLR